MGFYKAKFGKGGFSDLFGRGHFDDHRSLFSHWTDAGWGGRGDDDWGKHAGWNGWGWKGWGWTGWRGGRDCDDRHGGNGKDNGVEVSLLGTFDSGLGEGAAEIVAHDPETQRLFVTNGEDASVDILDISNPKKPTKAGTIDVSVVNGSATGGPNSVAVSNGVVAVAVEAETVTDPGVVAFFDADGTFLGSVVVGALPDMLTFTPNGKKILVANEGEADGGIDPKGSISIIDVSGGIASATVNTLDFTGFDADQEALEAAGLRIFDGKLLSDDVEPEYIAISEDGKTAFVTLQESNAVAVVDIKKGKIVEIQPLGAKDHSETGNGLDPNDRDGGINIETQPVSGLYMPDAIASYDAYGRTFYVTANEGDARDEDDRVGDLAEDGKLDKNLFDQLLADELIDEDPDTDIGLERLEVSTIDGDTDGDGDIDELFAYGARSFTIWDENGNRVFDSGAMIAEITAKLTPELFNANDGDPDEFDARSDAKGAEPESVVIGEVAGRTYAFVGLERAGGGVMVFDITRPKKVEFVQYVRTDGDIAPEGLDFITAKDSPTGVPLLVVANEVSGTTSLYEITFDGKTINGRNKAEKLLGTGGNDDINGRGGNDKIFGFAGNDSLNGGNGRDKVLGGLGDDLVNGDRGRDKLFGNEGDDSLNGGRGDDELSGGDGDDELTGGRGNDSLNGGDGLDTAVFSGNRADYLVDTEIGVVVDLRRRSPDGVDRIEEIEFLQFADETVDIRPNFTLELLHFTDQEANAATIDNIDRLSAVLNALRNEDLGNDGLADNTLTLSSGDVIIPGLFFDASEAVFGSAGIADIQIQNELGLQAAALGNHEFDLGTGFLASLIDGSAIGDFSALSGTAIDGQDFAGALFPYLSANLDFSTDANLAPLEVAGGQDTAILQNVVTSSSVSDVNGELIGIVGATVPTIDTISSAGSDLGIFPEDFDPNPTDEQLDALATVLQAEVDQLLSNNPTLNKVVLLSHMQQISIELALAERLENVDIIVAGGSNTRLFDDNDRIRDGDSDQGQYPLFVTNAGGTTTAVVNTDANYKYVGRLVIDFDPDGNVIPESYDETVSGAYATDEQGVADLGAEGLVDPEIDAITDAIQAQIVATESNVFGVSNVFLNGNRSGTFTADDTDGVRTQETNLGNLTADANLVYANEIIAANALGDPVVVSIKNGGGIRSSIGEIVVPAGGTEAVRLPNSPVVDADGNIVKPEGGVSQNDIQTVLAFNNGLTLLDVTKAELVAVLEGGVGALPTGVSGGFPQISGVKFSFDETLPAGDRIISAGIFDENDVLIAELVRNGNIVGDANEVFRVVTLDFLANGGDPVLSSLSNPNRVDLQDLDGDGVDDAIVTGAGTFADDGSEQDALAEYLNDTFNPSNGGTAYNEADTGPALDERIQNLSFRADTVLSGVVPPVDLVINEIRIDQDGSDNDEFFELFGESGASLNGLTYIVIGDGTGGSGVIEHVTDLSGQSLSTDGVFVAAESTFSLATADITTSLNFENSDNVTHLLVRDFTGASGDDLDTDDDGVLDVVPWAEIVDSVALIESVGSGDQVYSVTQVGPDGSFVPGHVFRSPDGTGDWQIGIFDPVGLSDTPGMQNPVAANVAIYDIQGAAHRSPLEGSLVMTTGIVTAIASNGFYMQDALGDADIATSDGIFVAADSTGISIGDAVEVEGFVVENQFGSDLSVTRIEALGTSVTSSGNALPSTVVLGVDRVQPDSVIDDDGLTSFDPTTDAIDFLESLEGMRVEVIDPLVVAGTSRFDEMALAANRGGESGSGILNATISDGDFNPEILLTDDALVTEPNAVTGDTFASNPVGVLDYTFGSYKLQLTETPVVVSGGRTAETTALAGTATQMTIATYNVFNLDPGDGEPGGTVDRLDTLAQSIVSNLSAPDVIALQEIQDNTGTTDDGVVNADQTLQELVDAIAAAGGPAYSFANLDPVDNADGGAPGSNIQNAFLYNPTRVSLDAASLQRIEDDAFEQGGDGTLTEAGYEGTRKPLVGTFTFLPTGEDVTVIGNHLKSKSQDDGLYGEVQPPVQNTLPQRVDQAGVVNDFVEVILSADPDANVVVLGDLNDFQFSDTLDMLANGGDASTELTNLVNSLAAEDQYSFIFNGNSQVLDHILVSDNLNPGAEVDIVHVNLDYGFPSDNASDHDPLVALLDLSGGLAIV